MENRVTFYSDYQELPRVPKRDFCNALSTFLLKVQEKKLLKLQGVWPDSLVLVFSSM